MKVWPIVLVGVLSVFMNHRSTAQEPFYLPFGGSLLSLDDSSSQQFFYIDSIQEENIWQFGVPSKTYLDQPYSSPLALITDTSSFYPASNFSTVEMQILPGETIMEFSFFHKYDTDTLLDGGTVEMSIDDGITWHAVTDSSYWWGMNYQVETSFPEDTIASLGGPGFSGISDGWELDHFWFPMQIGPWLDSWRVRFVFASDSIESDREGWMIDDVWIYGTHIGITESNFGQLVVYPNPAIEDQAFNVSVPFIANDIQYEIVGVSGQIMAEGQVRSTDRFQVQQSVPPGIYWLRIIADDQEFGQKLMVR